MYQNCLASCLLITKLYAGTANHCVFQPPCRPKQLYATLSDWTWPLELFDHMTYCWRVLTPASFSFISDFISLSSRARRATLVLDKAMSAFNKSGSCFIEEVLVTEDTKKEITCTTHSLQSFDVAMFLYDSNSV